MSDEKGWTIEYINSLPTTVVDKLIAARTRQMKNIDRERKKASKRNYGRKLLT